jgi:hypothetical protein
MVSSIDTDWHFTFPEALIPISRLFMIPLSSRPLVLKDALCIFSRILEYDFTGNRYRKTWIFACLILLIRRKYDMNDIVPVDTSKWILFFRHICFAKTADRSRSSHEPDIFHPGASRWLNVAILALAGLFLLGLFSTELMDSDAWWHLAAGRHIAHTHHLPEPDPFAHTTPRVRDTYAGEAATRHFNLTHEWLAQLVMYGIESAGGLGAVVLWKALLLVLLCGAVGWTAARRTGSVLWGVAAALGAATLALEFAHDRPTILSYVFTAVFIAVCQRGRPLWLLPALALVWANCHGGFFLGWLIVGAYAAEALLRRAPNAKHWLITALATIVLSCANPNGFGAIAAVLRYRQSPMQSTLLEWLPAYWWGPPYAFNLLLYAAALVMILSWRRVRPADWLLAAVFATASLMAFRNEMLIGVLAPILIADYFPWKRRLPIAIRYAAAGLLAGALIWGVVTGRFFQLRAAEWRFPAGAVRFLRDHNIRGSIFNTYEYGGYMIWQELPVFIDGRALSEQVFQDYAVILASPPAAPARWQMLERYGVTTIVVNAFEYNQGTLYSLVPALMSSSAKGWHLIYEDSQAMIFVRDPLAGLAALPAERVELHLENECRMHVDKDPKYSLCARTLADLCMRAQNREKARYWLRYYLDHPYGDDPEARKIYEQFFQK